MKNKKGFTLVELLAVIAILAILVIIALPNVINMYNKAQKETFLTEAKKVYSESEKKYLSNVISGEKTKVINSEDSSKLDMTGSKLQYCVILNNSGKVTDMKVSNGKWIASLKDGKTVEDLTIDDLEDGNLDGYNCKQNAPKVPEATNCTFDGDLVQGTEYVNGQYTYRYMQEFGDPTSLSMSNMNESSSIKLMNSSIVPLIAVGYTWKNMSSDGWGVILTDRTSTEPVTSKVCTYINGKPITSMSAMFYNSKASSIDLSSFNTSNVTNMSNMFENSTSKSLNLKNFDTSKVTDMGGMFLESQATSLDLSNFNTSKVTNMRYMFSGNKAKDLDLTNLDTSNVTDMSAMFYKSEATSLDLSSFDTSKVTDMGGMFLESQATSLDLSNFNTSKVTNMRYMFSGNKAKDLDLTNLDTSNVTDMSAMFYKSEATSLDLSSFDTSNVTDMNQMFYQSKVQALDLNNFDTSKVTNMSYMFDLSKVTSLKVNNFDTSKVTEMRYMFRYIKVSVLDLSSFDTSKVTDMNSMFSECTNLKTIYASDKFVTTNVTNGEDIFNYVPSLVGGNGTKYKDYGDDITYARIDTPTTPGYFTKK